MKPSIDWSADPLNHNHIVTLLAQQSTAGIARICFHETETSGLHVMLISIPPFTHYPIHRHLTCDEWYIVVHGKLRIGIYDVAGNQIEASILVPPSELQADLGSQGGLLMKHSIFHDTSTLEEGALFLEIRPGPFDKTDTEYLSD